MNTALEPSGRKEMLRMDRITIARHVAANPASVALLLSDDELDVTDLTVSSPRRSGVGFSADVDVAAGGPGGARGTITITPAADPGCELRLVLTPSAGDDGRHASRTAKVFVETLAGRARSRSYAA